MSDEILRILTWRAEVYRRWDIALKDFLVLKEYEKYTEIVQVSTQRLKEIRENVRNLEFPDEIAANIRKIEELEDTHLRGKVEYHKAKITGNDSYPVSLQEIEEEIMEQIQEIIAYFSEPAQ